MTGTAVGACNGAEHPLAASRRCAAALAMIAIMLCMPLAPCLAQAVPSQSSQVRIDEKITHYPVIGSSLEELRAQLQRRASTPGGGHGRTHSEITVEYGLDGTATGCRMRDLEVRLSITVMLPEWTPNTSAEPELAERWNRAADALERHEATHRSYARAAADMLRRWLLAIDVRSDCRVLRSDANKQLLRARLWQQFMDSRYDTRTRNGATEGAVL